MAEPGKKFTILSFVGGGIRGLMSVTILQKLCEKFPNIVAETDLIAGCSTGSIITSELSFGKTPKDLIDFFKGGEIKFYDKMDTDPNKPAYDIDEVFGSQYAMWKETRVSELDRKVLFVTFNAGGLATSDDGVVTPTPWAPVMYTNMAQDMGDVLIAKAATSSGAMPGQLGSYEGNVDGAFFNHDPTVAAIALAVQAGHKLEDITAITIGTGLMYDWIASDTHKWGANQWMAGDGNPFNNTPPFLMNQSTPGPILDMCLNGTSCNLMPTLAGFLLGDRYVNLNPTLPFFIPENTTYPEAIQLLQDKGRAADTSKAEALIEAYWWNHVVGGGAEGDSRRSAARA
ncbi:patatin-like phospholipase/acyl hydrolase [Variovorax boronicumulans]|uniref:patatin-like phospholipase family protein n=1 Tax=Variovorax boronicumulans TaxID=436515 RepID=UPI002474F9BB|nr:patatin-like phospholipase family protein [Variovorax boronicumulans]MDH6167671.1 patatin-like phospholipase/acyl hydrolase [Variovorax boronicumulans]